MYDNKSSNQTQLIAIHLEGTITCIRTKIIEKIKSYAQLLNSILNLVLNCSPSNIVPGIKLSNIFVKVIFTIGARITFETSENTLYQTMQTLKHHLTTDIIKQYSIKSTGKKRKQTIPEISTMYTTDLKAQTKQLFQGTINQYQNYSG